MLVDPAMVVNAVPTGPGGTGLGHVTKLALDVVEVPAVPELISIL